MIAHISIGVRDIDRSKRFCDAVLEPLGHTCLKGPIAPNSNRLIPRAKEIVARDQWNSFSSGTISTPDVERTPAAMTVTAKQTATMTQA
jgi:hypothetical protein